jgi:hypothetical protein
MCVADSSFSMQLSQIGLSVNFILKRCVLSGDSVISFYLDCGAFISDFALKIALSIVDPKHHSLSLSSLSQQVPFK